MTEKHKLKGAIVGFGFISSQGHMPAYLERKNILDDVEIVAICDICPERKNDIPAGIRFYTDYEKLLDNEIKLDFLDVSTHAADHYKISKNALQRGLHVLCEKPLTTSIEEAADLIQTAVANQRVLFPCHNYKHAPVINAIRDVVESGKIGNVKSITLNTYRNTHAVGSKGWKPDWRRYKEYSGGGIAMDHGSHSLYLTFEWLKGYPKSVTASAQNFSFPKYDTEDSFQASYEFETGHANLYLSWTAGVRKVIYTLQGEKGALTVDDDNVQLAIINENLSESISHKASWVTKNYSIKSDWMNSSHASWFNSMFDQFKLAITNNDFQNSEIMDAYFCIQSIVKAYESINNNSSKISLYNNFQIDNQLGGLA